MGRGIYWGPPSKQRNPFAIGMGQEPEPRFRKPKKTANLSYNRNMDSFMKGIQKTIVQQPDFRGIGVHGTQKHGRHGFHSQVSIGLDDTTINFRRSKKRY